MKRRKEWVKGQQGEWANAAMKYRDNLIILVLALCGVLVHLVFYNNLEFHRDELLYFSLGEHPDFGYFSVPPLIGILAAGLTKIFGYSLLAAKILPVIMGGVMVYLAAKMAKELKGSLFAQILASIGLMCSIMFLRTYSLFQPVFLDIFFWTLTLYLLLRYINSDHNRYLYFMGVVIGLGILNKYNLLFLLTSLLVILPFTKMRKILFTKDFYLMLLIAFVLILPNVIWQITHHLPVLSHLEELKKSQLEKMSHITFLVEQLLLIYPATFIALPGIFYLIFNRKIINFRWIGYSIVVVLMLYLALHGKSYYAAGIYPLLISAGAVFYENLFRNKFLRAGLVVALLLLTWSALPMGIPSESPEKLVVYFDKMAKVTGNDAVRRYENNKHYPLPQDYADMLGWEELAAITNRAWQLAEHKDQCIIYAENYGQAGAITILGKKYNLPEAISFSDNFRYWLPKTFDREILEFIYINHELGKDIKLLFSDIREVGRITNPLAREYGAQVYLCKNPRSSFNKFWESRISAIDQK